MKKLLILLILILFAASSYSQQTSFKIKKNTCDSVDVFKALIGNWLDSTKKGIKMSFFINQSDSVLTLDLNNKMKWKCEWGGATDHTGGGCAFYIKVDDNVIWYEFMLSDDLNTLVYNDKIDKHILKRIGKIR